MRYRGAPRRRAKAAVARLLEPYRRERCRSVLFAAKGTTYCASEAIVSCLARRNHKARRAYVLAVCKTLAIELSEVDAPTTAAFVP